MLKFNTSVILSIFLVLLFGCNQKQFDFSPEELTKRLEHDLDLKSGMLPNGLRYYFVETTNTHTTLQLNVNVGSADEDEDERGLAHLVEHMAFQGTEQFSFEALQTLYRDVGMSLGPDINATTSLYKTQYVATVPNNEGNDEHFYRLADWMADISKGKFRFDERQLATEKTVVNNERLTKDKESYAYQSTLAFLKQSDLLNRLPIGDKATVANATEQQLASFVSKHYHPSSNSLVIVGNISKERLAHIKSVFGGNEKPRKIVERQPLVSSFDTFIYQAKDASSFSHALIIHGNPQIRSRQSIIEYYMAESFRDILFERLKQSNDLHENFTFDIEVTPYFLFDFKATSIVFDHDSKSYPAAIQTLTQELTRLRVHGLTEAEYKTFVDKWQDYEVSTKNEYTSFSTANKINARLDNGGVYRDVKWEQELAKAYLSDIGKIALEKHLTDLLSKPVRWGFSGTKLDSQAINNQIAVASRIQVAPPTEQSLPLVPVPDLKPAQIIKESKRDKIIEWHLSNGVKVILEPRDYSDRISYLMVKDGGLNGLQTIEDYDAASIAPSVFAMSGQNWIKPAQMEALLRTHKMSLNPVLNDIYHGIEIQSEAKDSTLAFSILYNAMQNAVINEKVFKHVKNTRLEDLKLTSASETFHAQLNLSRSGEEATRAKMTPERMQKVSLKNVKRIYNQLFQQVDGYTLVIVGKFTPEAIRDDVLTFVGGLPQGESYTNRERPPYSLPSSKKIEANGNEKGKSHFHFGYQSPVTRKASIKERIAFLIVANTLQQRLFDVLREEKGWVYNVSVRRSYNNASQPLTYLMQMSWSTPSFKAKQSMRSQNNLICC
ncbi:hypothetical protein CS022_12255 [Veronia nyctiphanis]|uniref:Uncharacterized protein n=1 Tax=Veronia nyctiphanis TaxID=1278244 RepID=A0A4Q0YV90_9GAMM|nr:insulinase family protein [Veronia nyctiphanis]RXJ73049.1 hypothetical protein CS022_12255 [Veronia nyctiphanis]